MTNRINLLMALLNSTPVVHGSPTDELSDDESARRWLGRPQGWSAAKDLPTLRAGRDLLQAVVRGEQNPGVLEELFDGLIPRPSITDDGLTWIVEAAGITGLLVDAVMAWDELHRTRPGRLRSCANEECALFLLDRSKSNSGRWCSMATCGNRLKARRHHQRARHTD